MPGDNVEMICHLHTSVAAEVGTRFTLREGGKTSECFWHRLMSELIFRSWNGYRDPDLVVGGAIIRTRTID
jgi:hypothetical protein